MSLSTASGRRRGGRVASGHGRHRRPLRPMLWGLEDRVLLAGPAPVNQIFSATDVTQLANPQSIDTFLGGSFNSSSSFGSIDQVPLLGDFGAQVSMSLGGKAGLDLNFSGSGGKVRSSYNATLTQGFSQPTGFGQLVTFDPSNTSVRANSGSFSTSSPSFGYGASVDLAVNGDLGGHFAVGDSFGGDVRFGGGLSVPLMDVNDNDSGVVSLLGVPFVGSSPGLGLDQTLQGALGAVENFVASKYLYYGLSEDPPLRLKVGISSPANLELSQDLQLHLGIPEKIGPYSVPSKAQGFDVNAGLDLGSMTEEAPIVALSSGSLQPGNVLSASGEGKIAQLSLQLGALTGPLLGLPALSALGTTDSINLGPLAVNFTPIGFQLQPTLTAAQHASIQPVSQLTYRFTNAQGQPIQVDGTLDGQLFTGQTSVTFTPGKDTLALKFTGQPITVTPSWNFQELYNDEVDLDADLDAQLQVGKISFHVPGLGDYTFGPLYQQSFQFANATLQHLFNQTTTIFNQTQSLAPFTIGGQLQLQTTVTSAADSSQQGSGSLRYAILSANVLSASDPTAAVPISVPSGTYNLTLPSTYARGEDGTGGDLLVTGNIIITGAGAGRTFINQEALDRVLHVKGGGSLTLVGVTVEGGDAADAHDPNAGYGGGILQDARSSLEVDASVVTKNSAPAPGYSTNATYGGGGISSSGALTLDDSTVGQNTAGGNGSAGAAYSSQGGGILVRNGSAVLRGSTVSGNTVSNAANAYGGGMAVVDSPVTIQASTFSGNTADGEAYSGGALTSTGQGDGGGLYDLGLGSGGNVLIAGSTFSGNRGISRWPAPQNLIQLV